MLCVNLDRLFVLRRWFGFGVIGGIVSKEYFCFSKMSRYRKVEGKNEEIFFNDMEMLQLKWFSESLLRLFDYFHHESRIDSAFSGKLIEIAILSSDSN